MKLNKIEKKLKYIHEYIKIDMASFTFTNGLIMLVESDKKGEWWSALKWQQDEFIKAMRFGTMKSMCFPNPIEYSDNFEHDSMKYRFIIENDWGPCWIENLTTNRKRKIQYFELGNIYGTSSFDDPPKVITSKCNFKK